MGLRGGAVDYKPIKKFQDKAFGWLLGRRENMLALLEIALPKPLSSCRV